MLGLQERTKAKAPDGVLFHILEPNHSANVSALTYSPTPLKSWIMDMKLKILSVSFGLFAMFTHLLTSTAVVDLVSYCRVSNSTVLYPEPMPLCRISPTSITILYLT
jgi:hypothetical protein